MLKQLDTLIGLASVMTLVSLLVTIISQVFLNWANKRGTNLRDALEAMFKTLCPQQTQQALDLAHAVLTHPIISDSTASGDARKLASAINPHEILSILENLAGSGATAQNWIGQKPGTTTPANLVQAAKDVLTVLRDPGPVITDSMASVNAALKNLPTGLATDSQELVDKAKDELLRHLQPLTDKVEQLGQNASQKGELALQNLTKWFDTAQQRSSEWFTSHAQRANVIIAFLLAFVLQLDLGKLYHQLSTDDAYRAAMVASAGKVQAQAEQLQTQISVAVNPGDTEKALASVKQIVSQIDTENDKSGFQIIPSYSMSFSCAGIGEWLGVCTSDATGCHLTLRHFLGMVTFAGLLSMGAPFWFNILKALVNFRPALAKNVDDARAARSK